MYKFGYKVIDTDYYPTEHNKTHTITYQPS